MNSITIRVSGIPVGKGRPRFSGRTFSPVKVYTPERTANYEEQIRLSYLEQAGNQRFEKGIPLKISIRALFPIPKSASKKRAEMLRSGQIMHTHRPDADNIAKAVLDALNGLAFHDDAQICELRVSKAYSDSPATEISISEKEGRND